MADQNRMNFRPPGPQYQGGYVPGPPGAGFAPPNQRFPPPPGPMQNKMDPRFSGGSMPGPQTGPPRGFPPMSVPSNTGPPSQMSGPPMNMMPPTPLVRPNSAVNGHGTPPPQNMHVLPGGNVPPPASKYGPGSGQMVPGGPRMPPSSLAQPPPFMNGPTSSQGVGPPPMAGQFTSQPGPPPKTNIVSPPRGPVPPQIQGPGLTPPLGTTAQQMGGASNLGRTSSPAISQGSISTERTSGEERPGDLPVPFHGQGQYSHQVGMTLTPGITPNNSEPPSRKSSREPSPVENPTYDALEGGELPNTNSQQNQDFSNTGAPPMTGNQPVVSNVSAPFNRTQNFYSGTPPLSQGSPQTFAGPPTSGGPPNKPVGAPPTSFGAPPTSFGAPPTSFGAPPTTFGTPPTSSGAPPMPGAPPTSFGLPPSSIGAPPTQQRFGQPGVSQPAPGPPPTSFGAPTQFGAPPMSTGATMAPGPPPTGYGMPTRSAAPPPPQDMSSNRLGGTPSRPQYPQMAGMMPPAPQAGPQMNQQGMQNQQGGYQQSNVSSPLGPGCYPMSPPSNMDPLSQGFKSMSLQDRVVNLVQDRNLLPPEGLETVKAKLHHDFKKVNCNPDVFRCTLTSIPQTSSLLSKARLPLGILIHPFKDLSQLAVIQSSVIVRCRSCRTYINPFVFFVDSRRWKCNLCYRVNELPDEFSYDPVSKTYGDPQRRPEIKSSTIEFIAPSDYMLRPPQPAVYLFLLDVSFNAIENGYLSLFCQTMLEELDKIPGDSRTQIGFLAYDRSLYFFNLAEGLSQPQMLIVSDVDDIFLPCPDNLLVNLQESKELVIDLLNQLPTMFEGNLETGSALGAALQAAHKLVSPIGGRVTVMQTVLPTVGPGALQSREDPSQRSTTNVQNLGPATDFYKKLALDFSAQQVAVDLFFLNGQYVDIASIACASKYSGGCIQYYPSFHAVKNGALADKFEADLRRYLTRKIGFEAVMRIRCTKGLSIHTFHGNFFVRSTDLLSLPNINPDAGFGMQMSIEDNLVDTTTVCFQAALLYTSSKGERRIRVHTMCLPVTNQIGEVFSGADQQAIAALIAKMAADRSVTSSMSDARDALVNAAVDSLAAFGNTLPASQRIGSLPIVHSLRFLPAFVLSLIKYKAFRTGINTTLDDRVFAMQQCKSLPSQYLLMSVYPHLYPVHAVESFTTFQKGDADIPKVPILHLSSANIDRYGVYILDTYDNIYMYIGSAVPEQFCQNVLDQPNFMSIPEGMIELPELENETSELLRNFIGNLMDSRPGGATFLLIREDSKHRQTFFQYMVEDRTESSMSYHEFLLNLQKQIKS